MADTYSTNQFKAGLKIIQDQEPCAVLENEFVKPGKGHAFNRVRLKKLISGKIIEKTFRSGESVQSADVVERPLLFLYSDGALYYFMDPETFEQIFVLESVVGETKKWLTPQAECLITLWNNTPISIIPPNFVTLKITDTDPGVKGDTAASGGKPAHLESGAVVRVPLFLQRGDLVRIDTRTGEYLSRKNSST